MSLIPGVSWPIWTVGSTDPQNAINTAFLLLGVLARGGVLTRATAAQPATPDEGDAYILPADPTGDDWGAFEEDDLVFFFAETWFRIAPVDLVAVPILVLDEGVFVAWDGAAYVAAGTGSVSGSVPIVEVSGTSHTMDYADAGKILRFSSTSAKTVTVNTGLTVGREVVVWNDAASNLTIVQGAGQSVTPPKGGTLVLEPQDAVTLITVTSSRAKLFGSTVAA